MCLSVARVLCLSVARVMFLFVACVVCLLPACVICLSVACVMCLFVAWRAPPLLVSGALTALTTLNTDSDEDIDLNHLEELWSDYDEDAPLVMTPPPKPQGAMPDFWGNTSADGPGSALKIVYSGAKDLKDASSDDDDDDDDDDDASDDDASGEEAESEAETQFYADTIDEPRSSEQRIALQDMQAALAAPVQDAQQISISNKCKKALATQKRDAKEARLAKKMEAKEARLAKKAAAASAKGNRKGAQRGRKPAAKAASAPAKKRRPASKSVVAGIGEVERAEGGAAAAAGGGDAAESGADVAASGPASTAEAQSQGVHPRKVPKQGKGKKRIKAKGVRNSKESPESTDASNGLRKGAKAEGNEEPGGQATADGEALAEGNAARQERKNLHSRIYARLRKHAQDEANADPKKFARENTKVVLAKYDTDGKTAGEAELVKLTKASTDLD